MTRAPHLDFDRSPEGLGSLLSGAGLDVSETALTGWDWRVAPGDFWAGVTAVGDFGASWRAQTPGVQERMREAFAQAAAPWLIDDQLVFPVEAVMVWASA